MEATFHSIQDLAHLQPLHAQWLLRAHVGT